ncbi:hypothetical protein BFX40_29525 [Mesorhizobium sp. SEMIA 3007]|nr:hypothetical protein BFX40_29525 [Mesorhizobium sp. SEMIA 3007]
MIDKPQTLAAYSGTDATAAVMPANNDVPHAELIYSIFDDGEHIQIGGMDEVGDVAMHKNLARFQPGNDISWYATIRAADPEVFRILQTRKTLKIINPFGFPCV